jgi:hypothetical protein
MKLTDLTDAERLALGGLLRLMVRADGEFTEAEEHAVNELGDELGGARLLWSAISDSAQAFKTDQDVRRAGVELSRPEVRRLVLDALHRVARADSIAPGEQGILEALRSHWGL